MIVRNVAAPSEDCAASTVAAEGWMQILSKSSTEGPPDIGARSKVSTPSGQALVNVVSLI